VLSSGTAGGWFNDLSTSDPAREVVPAFTDWVVYSMNGEVDAPVVGRSPNRGATWTDACRPPDICPSAFQVHRTSSSILVGTGTETIDGVAVPVLMSSNDDGRTWTRQAVAAGGAWRAFFWSNQSAVAWSSFDHAYRSDDLGVTWSRFSVPVTGEVARDYRSPETVYVDNGGIWRFNP